MGVIAEGFNIGNLNLSSKYCLTQAQIDVIGDGEGYPDVFPIWNTDDKKIYIFYRTTEGTPNICRLDELPGSIEVPVLYPNIDPETNILTWEIRQISSEVPDPITLMGGKDGEDGQDGAPGAPGESAYETWLSLGHSGSEDDFIEDLKGEKGDPGDATDINAWTDSQIRQLKERLGIPEILDAIDNLQLLVSSLADRVSAIEEQLKPIDPDDDEEGGDTPITPPEPGDDDDEGGDTPPESGDGDDEDDEGGNTHTPTPDEGGDDTTGGDDSGSGEPVADPTNPDDTGDDSDDEGGNENASTDTTEDITPDDPSSEGNENASTDTVEDTTSEDDPGDIYGDFGNEDESGT